MSADNVMSGLFESLEARRTISDDGVMILVLTGPIDLSSRPRLRTELEEALAARPANLAIDLRGVPFCSSTGLEALIMAHRHASTAEIDLRIRPSSQLRRLIDLTGLTDVLALAE